MKQKALMFLVLGACVGAPKNQNINSEQALGLVEKNCISCHQQTLDLDKISEQYRVVYPEERKFVQAFIDFLSHPDPKKVLLKKELAQMGLMPVIKLQPYEREAIALYLYQNRLSDTQTPDSLLTNAKQIIRSAAGVLSRNLMQAIQQKGTVEALGFCSLKAIPLTDSLAKHHQVKLRRITDRPRNPINQANPSELQVMQSLKEKMQQGQSPEPLLQRQTDLDLVYMPIVMAHNCLQCHGSKQIEPTVLAAITRLYPKDKAQNYQEGELRGLWVLEIKR
jgi:mono/diheme cytochrome c family protein